MLTGPYERAKKYIESHQNISTAEKKHSQGPAVTLSRETGAGADVIADLICEILQKKSRNNYIKWTVFDKNLIGKIIEDHHLPEQIAKYLEEDKINAINSAIDEMFGLHPPTWVLIRKTTETIMQLVSLGNVIIVGRGSNVITYSMPNVVHIRFVAPLPDRIKHIQEKFDLSEKAALDRIKKDDAMRRDYLHHHYGRDVDDRYLYHLIINTHLIPYNEAAELVSNYVVNKFPQYF
jgi:hypothetical protein